VQKLLAKISDLETSLKSKSEEAVTVRGECDELRQRHAEALQNVASSNELQVTNVNCYRTLFDSDNGL
jgi:regulator of replication initiation timing